ncbi:hypothetical protein AJ79_00378 [Helicocarpus griseus UAMH5409]|uniref:Uncharacterized protein n=1 Tax=Helicocarpus griseus UAMH5409 TaxID=1447875 RepID=A0A2B7YBY3_9EURO|nr:hypothetical protein AJ79_00378 [Helicocarpus griseus UAMH5409]
MTTQYQSPASPCFDPAPVSERRGSYYRPYGWRRSTRRYNNRQRYYGQSASRARHSEWRYKTLRSARPPREFLDKWRPASDSSASSDEQAVTSSFCKPYPSVEGLLEQPAKIPRLISPNTRDQTFTEIMNGAFDLKGSPFSLGKKLASSAAFSDDNWMLQTPLEHLSSDTKSHTGSCSSTTAQTQNHRTQSQKPQQNDDHAPPLQDSQQEENINTVDKVSTTDLSAADRDPSTLVQDRIQPDPVTVGFGIAENAMPINMNEFSQLLQMIELHGRQSKDLADLVSNYLDRTGSRYYDISSLAGGIQKYYTKPLRRRNQSSENSLHVASLPGGGDSPDPPRDHQIPFRGHMIDRVDTVEPAVNVDKSQDSEGPDMASSENSADSGDSAATGRDQG